MAAQDDSTKEPEAIINYRTEYGVAKAITYCVAFIGYMLVLIGLILAFFMRDVLDLFYEFHLANDDILSYLWDSARFFEGEDQLGIFVGSGITVSGLLLIMVAQITRASIDTADHTREILKSIYKQN